eukprot:XP_014029346.1 PREDICTED: S-formylglutathione hydrolase isoform X3 [Salmo salar]
MALTQVATRSTELKCKMNFAIYLPPKAENGKCPVLYWLSGGCNIEGKELGLWHRGWFLCPRHPGALEEQLPHVRLHHGGDQR